MIGEAIHAAAGNFVVGFIAATCLFLFASICVYLEARKERGKTQERIDAFDYRGALKAKGPAPLDHHYMGKTRVGL